MGQDGATSHAKTQLRERLLAARRARTESDLARERSALTAVVLGQAAALGWTRVAAYEPLRTEPGSTELLRGLVDSGVELLVPITMPERVLHWERWPAHGSLGAEAIVTVDAVLVPALAVDARGVRLGRGRGYYDVALRHTPAPRVALLFDDEVLASVPADSWDEPMNAVATPSGWKDVPERNTGLAADRWHS